ncbi:secretin and TonB N-terminal domain-containing protein [Chitinimonas sp. PSY-7]|uniref:secretin and TonB N-terminal domain-containing protein n=1 Tax=Chitinimonas sp. PSY-7 TaxID=3459088 RepID=UPI00403FCC75
MKHLNRGSLFILLALISGCATEQVALDRAKQMLNEGRKEEGIAELDRLVKAYPENSAIRANWARQHEMQADQLVREADALRLNQQFEEAQARYQNALRVMPNHPRARDGLARLVKEEQQTGQVKEAAKAIADKDNKRAASILKQVIADNPRHQQAKKLWSEMEAERLRSENTPISADSPLNTPVTLEFRNAPLSSIFDVLSQSTGINFVFDKEAQLDGRTTIIVRDTPLNDALNVLLAGNQLSKRLLNDQSVMIYPANANRQKDIDPLHVKTFYLGNMEAKAALALLKTIIKTRDIYIDEKLNTLVMRDTPEAIAVAEKLLASQDLVDPEVVMDVEILEISNSDELNLGLALTDKIELKVPSGFTGANNGSDGLPTIKQLKDMGREGLLVNVANPLAILNLKNTDGATNTLANPRIRVKNREKAKIVIGDRVPVVKKVRTTLSVDDSVDYMDVGLTFEVTPQIYPNEEVGIKLRLESSNIVSFVKAGDISYPQIGKREAETILRLKDGETQVLAGLIKREDADEASRLPGLGNFPILGRLFSSEKNTRKRSELVLLITPRIVRNLEIPNADQTQFASGTENSIGADPLQLPSRKSKVSVPNGSGVTVGGPTSGLPPPAPPPPPPPPPANNKPGQGGTRP